MSRRRANGDYAKDKMNLQSSLDDVHQKLDDLKETVISNSHLLEINELKENINNLKETVNGQKNMMLLSNGQIKDLKETVINQNKIIVTLLSDLKVMVKSTVVPGQASTKYSDTFPIKSIEQLTEFENDITDETRYAMAATIKGIVLPCGLNKNIEGLIHIDLLLQFNVDGKQRKRRLLDYPKFVNLIYRAVFNEGYTKKAFLNDLRTAFRRTKGRCYKAACIKKVSSMNNTFLESEDLDENMDLQI